MKKSGLFVLLLVLLLNSLTFAANGDLGTSKGANGSESAPFLIEDFTDFQAFCDDSSKWTAGVHTRLETDLDLDPDLPGRQTYTNAPIAGDTDSDYTFDGTAFAGSFNGNNHVIKNLEINGAYYCGLFGKTESGCQITNLGILNSSIISSENYLGALCGYNSGTISNCYITGSVSCCDYCGGLCGYNHSGVISNCYSTSSVSGDYNLGGLCGRNLDGSISNCGTNVMLFGSIFGYYFGGLCGSNSGTINNCYSNGSITGKDYSRYIGGLCGSNSGTLNNCYSNGSITGEHETIWLGGLCGENTGIMTNSYSTVSVSGLENSYQYGGLCGKNGTRSIEGIISNCYFTGSVIGGNGCGNFGGGCGLNYHGKISNSFSTGSVSGGLDCIFLGGFCGQNGLSDWGSINNCYSSGDVSSGDNSSFIGSFCGFNRFGILHNNFSIGNVSCGNNSSSIGGFCGGNGNGRIYNSYSTGSVSGGVECTDLDGFCGYMTMSSHSDTTLGDISNCFWNTQTSGISDPETDSEYNDSIRGLTTTQMQTQATFTDAGWDFNAETDNGTEDLWHMPYNATGYPMLYWQRDIPGDTTGKYGVDLQDFTPLAADWLDPYTITDLQTLAQYWLEQ